jgi:hypothetical protein
LLYSRVGLEPSRIKIFTRSWSRIKMMRLRNTEKNPIFRQKISCIHSRDIHIIGSRTTSQLPKQFFRKCKQRQQFFKKKPQLVKLRENRLPCLQDSESKSTEGTWLGWKRNFAIRNFALKINFVFREILFYFAKFRDCISRNFAK